jgi:hypothetical protein
VPVVLNMISSYEMTQKPLPRFGLGACLPVPMAAAAPASKGAVAFRRPPAPVAGTGLHFALTVSGQAVRSAAKSNAASDQQSAYNTTLTIADGAGDLGPHPPREPV